MEPALGRQASDSVPSSWTTTLEHSRLSAAAEASPIGSGMRTTRVVGIQVFGS
jgi:hypothetical protein